MQSPRRSPAPRRLNRATWCRLSAADFAPHWKLVGIPSESHSRPAPVGPLTVQTGLSTIKPNQTDLSHQSSRESTMFDTASAAGTSASRAALVPPDAEPGEHSAPTLPVAPAAGPASLARSGLESVRTSPVPTALDSLATRPAAISHQSRLPRLSHLPRISGRPAVYLLASLIVALLAASSAPTRSTPSIRPAGASVRSPRPWSSGCTP